MTGWRIGWMVLPAVLVPVVERLAANFFVSPPYISQVAAEAALDCQEELEENRRNYARAREVMTTGLQAAGFTHFAPPDGAFYLYVDLQERGEDSAAFCARLLEEHKIATTPGYDFDPARGGRYLRMSYCAKLEDIEAAMARLQRLR
jgi:aspartate/methionine/tyrosine aminotransferase